MYLFSPFWTVTIAFFMGEMGKKPGWPPSPWRLNANERRIEHEMSNVQRF